MTISMIAAMANRRVIGYQNQLPWHLPNDLAFFKKHTLHKPIIMGRKSFDSLGKPLPERRNIVITRDNDFQAEGIEVVHSLADAIALVKDEPEIMIGGGASIYQQAMAIADYMYLTFIDGDFDGDTYFPLWDSDSWQIVSRDSHLADEKNAYDHQFVLLERISAVS